MLITSRRARALAALLVGAGLLLAVATPQSAVASGGAQTKFGSYVQVRPGETWPEALSREERTYGNLQVLRLFQGAPQGWTPDKWTNALHGRMGIVSFGLTPAQVLSGRYDQGFREFFRYAPRTQPTWWTYFHEPDVAYLQGRLTDRAAYRAAFRHVATLARQADNPMLKTTLVLVGWSGNPRSGQSIQDYWPGKDLTDVIGWDVYNGWAIDRGSYGTMDQLALDVGAAEAVGKPWGVAEFGSLLLRGDNGSGRAAWITKFSHYSYAHGARFVSYFDTDGGPGRADYRLTDAPSQRAWRSVVSGLAPWEQPSAP